MSETNQEKNRSDEAATAVESPEAIESAESTEAASASEDEPQTPDGEPAAAAETADSEAAPPDSETEAAVEPEKTEPPPEATAESGEPAASEESADAAQPTPSEESAAVQELRARMDAGETVEGNVIGWNKGGFHVVVDGVTTFCPHSEMELSKIKAPKQYLDKDFEFAVLRIEDGGRRVVLSRTALLRQARTERKKDMLDKVRPGATLRGRVASLTDFGAFVDLGGVQGLVHVSEISRKRVEDPSSVLDVNQPVDVKVLKVEQGGKRISLSMKALEPDPWDGVAERFSVGSVVEGKVERTANFGAFVALEPGLTGLLPASMMNLPRGAQPARVYSPGKKLQVQIMSIDPRRRRISLAPEGSQVEGSRSDYESYKKRQRESSSSGGFNALASALEKLQNEAE